MIVAGHFSRCPLRACARAAADAATGIPATTSEYFTGRPLTVRARLTDVRRDGLAQIRWSSEQVSLADQAQRMDLGQMLCHSRAAPHVVPTIIATLINRLTKSDIPCSKDRGKNLQGRCQRLSQSRLSHKIHTECRVTAPRIHVCACLFFNSSVYYL